tara:strand:+ start:1754 stop:2440 length:687 start_codon:yes stop_codon:yes gene_type:complete
MANSYIEYTSGLTETTYDVPFNVLSIDDVNVKGYNGSTWSDLTVSSRDASAKTLTLDGAPSAYQKIRVWRNTGTTQLVDFQNGSRLSESDLDTAYQQGLFVAQEVSENASTEIEGIGPQGIQGVQGVAGNDGADGADGADASAPIPAAGAIGAYSFGRPSTTGAIAIGATSTEFRAWQQSDVANVMYYSGTSVVNATSSSQTGTWRCMSGCATGGNNFGLAGLWLRIA